jgi:DNA polymerase-3 subunit delta'
MEAELIGHQQIRAALDRAVAEGRVHHAYLLHGPPSVGKSTLARWLALRLNCPEPGAPCGECRTCRLILKGAHPDVRSLQPPSDRDPSLGLLLESRDESRRTSKAASRIIGVDDVRALQRDAALAPSEALWKVYLVIGAESMNLEAANCLLKTLEEPPSHVVLILTAADTYDLLPTILSRCQTIRLPSVPTAAIEAALGERHLAGAAQAAVIARLAGGRPGWALRAVGEPAVLEARDRAFENLAVAARPGFRERLTLAEQLASGYSKDPQTILDAIALWQLWWWDVYLLQGACADLITNVDQREWLEDAARTVAPARLRAHLDNLALASQRLLQNVNPRLALEALLVAAPSLP